MPAISSRFNRFLPILLIPFLWSAKATAQAPQLADEHWQWLAARIYQNECANREACLTSWNAGEEFPSLGIGHFIWYPQAYRGPFEESFPGLLRHLAEAGIDLPAWLVEAGPVGAPWPDRDTFYTQIDTPKMGQLRRLLADHQREQVEYIVDRFYDSLPAMLAQFPPGERPAIESMVTSLAQTSPPHGLYALIDYVHFKGSGVAAGERYLGQGWGLAQVLEWMQVNGQQASLENFITAADAVLTRRVVNAPPQRDEQRWLNGWRARLQTYRPPVTP